MIGHRPALAPERMRFVGEPVACVVADSLAAAPDGAEAVAVDYEDLPAAIGLDAAFNPDAPVIHDEAPGNVAVAAAFGDEVAVAAATHVVETVIDLPRRVPNPMEPRAVIASWDAAAGAFHVVTPHQGLNPMRDDLAAVFGLPPGRIHVEAADVGGAFGARTPAYPEHAAPMLAARLTGRRVRWTATRTEAFLADHHGRGSPAGWRSMRGPVHRDRRVLRGRSRRPGHGAGPWPSLPCWPPWLGRCCWPATARWWRGWWLSSSAPPLPCCCSR